MQNPLEAYRRSQREVRRHFEPFTRVHCETCPTPCCRKPARILPTDILLAEANGWQAREGASSSTLATRSGIIPLTPVRKDADISRATLAGPDTFPPSVSAPDAGDQVAATAGAMVSALGESDSTAGGEGDLTGEPCDFLGERGCTFPDDLRPFGCTTYICKYMYARMERQELSRLKRAVRDLEEKHAVLMRSVRNVSWGRNK